MGVTRENRDLFIYGMSDDELELLQHNTEDESQTAEDLRLGRKNGSRHRMRTKPCQFLDNQGLNGRKTGARHARRMENFRQLMTLAEKDELGELQLDNVFEPSVSAFTRLFTEREQMKIWNDFVNRTEEEQERILHPASASVSRDQTEEESPKSESLLDETWVEIPDKRAAHPAFTAEDCYRKIDRKLKDLLKKRHLRMEILESLEEEIVAFFKEWPTSVFLSKLASSYERMLAHAVCQFLDLRSQSYDENGERRTQIENKHDTFLPPSQLLSQYLQQQQASLQCR